MRNIVLLAALSAPVAAIAQPAGTPPVQSVPATNYQAQGLGQTAFDLFKQVIALNAQVAELQDRLKTTQAENDTLKSAQHTDKTPAAADHH